MNIRSADEGAAPIPAISVEHFSVPSQLLRDSHGSRLDASHFNPAVARALEVLRHSGMRLARLGDLADRIFIPPRFKRIYVEREHGLPFLQGSHVVHLRPADVKFLSLKAHKKLDRWIIRKGWILVTCSGTIGNAAIVPADWDGWAASQHVLRIIPNEKKCPSGYLYSFLVSPLGRVQLTNRIYGAVVDELTEDQTKSVVVPIAANSAHKKHIAAIYDAVLKAVEARSLAVSLLSAATENIETLVGRGGDEPKICGAEARTG